METLESMDEKSTIRSYICAGLVHFYRRCFALTLLLTRTALYRAADVTRRDVAAYGRDRFAGHHGHRRWLLLRAMGSRLKVHTHPYGASHAICDARAPHSTL
eukprot:666781-Rhodomonas_salina.2